MVKKMNAERYFQLQLILISSVGVYGQIQGLFSQLFPSRQMQDNDCTQISVSCLPSPWCRLVKDDKGCTKCSCDRHGTSKEVKAGQRAAMNPFASMFGSGGSFGFPGYPSFNGQMGPMNPMAAMFGGGSPFGGGGGNPMSGPMGMSGVGGMGGGMGSMSGFGGMGSHQTATPNPDCDPAPFTCPAPPPWCQRTVNEKGCVKCYCGEELQHYLAGLQGKEQSTTPDTNVTDNNSTNESTTTNAPITTQSTLPLMTSTTLASLLGKPCLANFMCTLDCRTGFQTDQNNCPMCACNGKDGSQLHVSTASPSVKSTTGKSTTANVITCPGIFSCMKQCMNGYVVDGQGCPLCQCVPDS